jgi:hypothetical protein
MSTYSPSLGLEEITPGDQAGLWGDTTNNNLNLIDQAITGVQPLSFAGVGGTTQTLVATDGSITSTARSAVLNITGTATASNTVIVPNKQKTYLVRNNTTQDVIFSTASPTTPYTVSAGNSTLIFCDGNNGVFPGILVPGGNTVGVAGGGTGSTTFGAGGFVVSAGGTTALTTLPYVPVGGNQADLIIGQVQPTKGGTGLSNISIGSLLAGNGTSVMTVLPTGTSGQVLTSNGAGANPSWQAAGTGLLTSNNSWTGTNAFTQAPTVGGANVLTTSTGAALSSSPTFTGGVTATGFAANGAVAIGDQKFTISYGGYSSGMSAQGVQIGASGRGIIYDGTYVAFGGINGGTVVTAGSAFGFFSVSTDNAQKPSGGSWLSSSDSRLKENITPYTKGLDAVKALRTVTFTLKDNVPGREQFRIDPNKVVTGVIAQETLETPLASIISTGTDGYYMVDPSELTWTLVNAVKELSAKVDAQAAEIAALKG